jgi:AP-1 complex subunit gamma-1
MLSIAGSTLPDERISSALIMLIQRNPELHAYVVHKLFWALHDDASQLSLVHVGLWCIGEYSQLLLLDAPASEETLSSKARVDESTIVQLLKTILRHHVATDTTRAYALTAMAKLTTRFRSPAEIQALNSMTKAFSSSMVLELQQRATEYAMLDQPQWSSLRPDVFAMMPAMDASKIRNRHGDNASMMSTSADLLGDDSGSSDSVAASSSSSVPLPAKPQQQASLLDLDDIFGGSVASNSSSAAPFGASTGSTSAPPAAAVDLLADIFSTGPSPAAPVPAATTVSSASDLLGLLDFGAPAAVPAPVTPAFPPVRAYEKNGLTVDLEITKPNKDDPSVTFITATTRNGSAMPVDKFVFLAAFPKYIKLKMEPPSGDALPANNAGAITQVVKIQNTMQGEVRDTAWLVDDFVNGFGRH